MKNKIGSYLRQHRETRKLTLQQAAEETGIREPYLAALEEGDFHKIPGDVYAGVMLFQVYCAYETSGDLANI